MSFPADFVASLKWIHPRTIVEQMNPKQGLGHHLTFGIRNEIRPVDLYCYLGGRFGQPNGIQNFLRNDDSANFIHWDWTLQHATGLVMFLGMNFRTEILVFGEGPWALSDQDDLISQIRKDLAPHGSDMGRVRNALEHWTEFVNPYQRIRRATDKLLRDLDALDLQPGKESEEQPWDPRGVAMSLDAWKEVAERYSRGFGLCFGIRSMLPVLAEAFINLILYLLMRPELKRDDRLRESVFRQPIDVRIKSLSINCRGFERQIDYSSEACKRYHSLVNERNDLLHGNVVIDRLKFNEVCFIGKVPVFREYRSAWQRGLGVEMKAVGLQALKDDVRVVDDLIEYVLSCVDDKLRDEVRAFTDRYELGVNMKDQRIGVLFPQELHDFWIEVVQGSAPDVGADPKAAQPGVGPDDRSPSAPARRSTP
jgi:hypothetical protein